MRTPPDPVFVRAQLAVARLAHDEVERAGLLDDDRVEAVLAAVARWLCGEAARRDVRAAREELFSPRQPPVESAVNPYTRGGLAMGYLRSLAWDLAAYVGGGVPPEARAVDIRTTASQALGCCYEDYWTTGVRVRAVYEAALQEARERAARQDGGG